MSDTNQSNGNNVNSSSSEVFDPDKIVSTELKKKRKGPVISYKENPAWEFPQQPDDFSHRFPDVRWGSEDHDRLGKFMFKNKSSTTHTQDFPKHFPRYALVTKSKRAYEPYARRKVRAFLRKGGENANGGYVAPPSSPAIEE